MKALTLISSMRTRLTLWYTSVLAFVLLIFAITSYSYLERAARQRTDASLADTANSLISNFNSEMNDENQSPADSAKDAASGLHFRDRQLIVFDQHRNFLVASETPKDFNLAPDWFVVPGVRSQLSELANVAFRNDRAYDNLFSGNDAVRVFAIKVTGGVESLIFVVANPLRDEQHALAQVRAAFYIAVPIALLIAGLGGYLLARKSLAPVVSMGEQAARIQASNLAERIPVPRNNIELGRLAQVFNELLARLQQSFEQQKRFMADASHELRTPVAVICGESEVALSNLARNTDEYRESLAIVHDEGMRLTRMVEDLFMLTRADTGQYPLALVEFYLDESINECVRSVRSLAAQKELEISYQPTATELAYRGDEAVIRRLMLNLLHNAIKYTPARGRVSVALKENCEHLEILVSDTGVGIAPEDQPYVFERFFRVDRARSRGGNENGSGAGLGLSIARWAAELHGGSLELDRSDSHGTTFVVSLPYSRSR
jgi:heavy metal sensor kinase